VLGPNAFQVQRAQYGGRPLVTVHDINGNVIASNDNWKDTNPAAITATGKPPPNNLEAAILPTVPNGNYTAIVSG
jgi:hypothetical protein